MSEAKKCSNPACSSIPPDGKKTCGPHCEAIKGASEVICECGHHTCKGEATKV
jgi:hypothetical protein